MASIGIGLGNDQRNAVLGGAAVDGSCLPDVGIGKTDNTRHDFGGVFLVIHVNPP